MTSLAVLISAREKYDSNTTRTIGSVRILNADGRGGAFLPGGAVKPEIGSGPFVAEGGRFSSGGGVCISLVLP